MFQRIFVLVLLVSLLNSCAALQRWAVQQAIPHRGQFRNNLIRLIDTPIIEKNAMAGAVKTRYIEAGEGPPLVLIHGTALSGPTWYPVFAQLAKKYRVIAPDMVGHGESDKPKGAYTREFYAQWLKDFLTALDIDKASLVGSSLGGSVVLEFGLRYPQMTDKIILSNSASLNDLHPEWGFLQNLFDWHSHHSLEAARNLTHYLVHDPKTISEDVGRYAFVITEMPSGTRAFKSGGHIATQRICPESLKTMQPPVLLLWGADDTVFPLKDAQDALAYFPRGKLVVLDHTKHAPFFEKPDAFAQALTRFLEQP